MKSLWNEGECSAFVKDSLKLIVYSTRLLGRAPELVLHGGGNSSVKTKINNIFGDVEDIIYIKGSGYDMETIEEEGFAPARLDILKRMAGLDQLSDADMVDLIRAAMINQKAPNPSLEAILHAVIPFKYVFHTHSDAVVALTNNRRCRELIKEVYGSAVMLVPYYKPGFKLSKAVYELTKEVDFFKIEGLIIENHGVFIGGDNCKIAYEKMIRICTQAEEFLKDQGALESLAKMNPQENLSKLVQLRLAVSKARGAAVVALSDRSSEACGFAGLPNLSDITSSCCITPDHAIRTKPSPAIISEDVFQSVKEFVNAYNNYFERYDNGEMVQLDPAPRWAVWPNYGMVSFGRNLKEAQVVFDIAQHTMKAIQWGEALGGWKPVSEDHIFDMEYWELQQAKLKKTTADPEFQGKIVLVTGAASGIGFACAQEFNKRGAAIVGVDLSPKITETFYGADQLGLVCDVTDYNEMQHVVNKTIRSFGGLDILVLNAGIFTPSMRIEDMNSSFWNKAVEINLTSQQRLLQMAIPYLRYGINPAVIIIASKNVPAPGPGAAAYSVTKAGLVQLARVAALELAGYGIRVNMCHPDAVYDTGIWTEEVLKNRSAHYGLTVQEYKTKNLLKTELRSKDIAELVCAMAGAPFAKTTGAQVPIDGGSDRVI